MARKIRRPDPHYIILGKINARVLPPEPPADLEPAYRAVVLRLMINNKDKAANVKAMQLRAEESRRLRGGR